MSYEQISISVADINNTNRQLIAALYRPPSKSQSQFIEELHQHLDEVLLHSGTLTVCGDLNIYLEKDTPTTTSLHQLLEAHNIQLNNTAATHIHGHTIDAVATESPVTVKLLDQVYRIIGYYCFI
jgi:exonuclease III